LLPTFVKTGVLAFVELLIVVVRNPAVDVIESTAWPE